MSLFIFVKSILEGKPINVHNEGRMERDFTYVEDIVRGVAKVLESPARSTGTKGQEMDPAMSSAPYRIYNIGNSKPVRLMDFIAAIEDQLGRKAIMNMMPIQPGEVEKTWADVSDLEKDFKYKPDTPVKEGMRHFIEWYRSYYRV
jgi:UDP-glucuronate 4-epimerase